MAHSGNKLVIYAAITGNLAIAVTKFVAAAVTGSSAMLSEGIHSVVDTGNGLVMLWGIRQSQRPADANHPFGWGQELYFWTLIVAILIFAIGGGISFYEGVLHVLNPRATEEILVNYLVLGFSILFEGISWGIAFREFRKHKGGQGYLETIHKSKDPTTFVVFFEDTAALAGLLVALVGITLGHYLGIPELDGAASIVIGLILSTVAILLAVESKELLIGEAADPQCLAEIRAIAEADPSVELLRRALTMHFGPHEVLLNMEIQFKHELTADNIAGSIDRIERAIRAVYPDFKHIFLEAKAPVTEIPPGASPFDSLP